MLRKKFILGAVLFTVCFSNANAQAAAVIDVAAIGTMIEKAVTDISHHAEKIISFEQMIENGYKQIQQQIKNVENTKTLVEDNIDNMRTFSDIDSWKDFMSWTNRQMYLMQAVERRAKNVKVRVGGKDYGVMDAADLPDAYSKESQRIFNEYSEKDRYKMWVTLGLTPSNYQYAKTWETREKDFLTYATGARDLAFEEHEKQEAKNIDLQKRIQDGTKTDKDGNPLVSDQAMRQMQIEAQIDTNRQLMALNEKIAMQNDQMATEAMAKRKAGDRTPASDIFYAENSYYQYIEPGKHWWQKELKSK